MAKDTLWFPHDYNSRNSDNTKELIDEYGSAGYGEYWIISEMLHEEDGSKIELTDRFYRRGAKSTKFTLDQYKKFIEDCCTWLGVFRQDGNFIFIDRVVRNKEGRERIRNKRIEAGKKGGEANASNIKANATQNEANASKIEANGKQNEANSSTLHNTIVIPHKEDNTSTKVEDINISAEILKKYEKNEWFDWPNAKLIIQRKEDFATKIKPYIENFGKELCNDFWFYWTQPQTSKNGKLAWHGEKKFDIQARLRTFQKNQKK